MTQQFNSGDLVRHKAGGPVMAVEFYDGAKYQYKTSWLSDKQEQKSGHFGPDLLESATGAPCLYRPGTFFKDENGKSLGDYPDGVLPIPLYKGMTMTIEGHPGAFEVVDWNFHYGNPDRESGLRIILRRK